MLYNKDMRRTVYCKALKHLLGINKECDGDCPLKHCYYNITAPEVLDAAMDIVAKYDEKNKWK